MTEKLCECGATAKPGWRYCNKCLATAKASMRQSGYFTYAPPNKQPKPDMEDDDGYSDDRD